MTEPDISKDARGLHQQDRLIAGVGGLFVTLLETHQAIRHVLEVLEAGHASPSEQRASLKTAKLAFELANRRLTEEGNDFFGVTSE